MSEMKIRAAVILVVLCATLSRTEASASGGLNPATECSFNDGYCTYNVLLSHQKGRCFSNAEPPKKELVASDKLADVFNNFLGNITKILTRDTEAVSQGMFQEMRENITMLFNSVKQHFERRLMRQNVQIQQCLSRSRAQDIMVMNLTESTEKFKIETQMMLTQYRQELQNCNGTNKLIEDKLINIGVKLTDLNNQTANLLKETASYKTLQKEYENASKKLLIMERTLELLKNNVMTSSIMSKPTIPASRTPGSHTPTVPTTASVSETWPPKGSCKTTWRLGKSSVYCLVPPGPHIGKTLSFHQARVQCTNIGAKLVAIETKDEHEFLKLELGTLESHVVETIKPSKIYGYWTSGLYTTPGIPGGEWHWNSTGKQFTYTDWVSDAGEKYEWENYPEYHCLMIWKAGMYQYDAFPCSNGFTYLGYVCERPNLMT